MPRPAGNERDAVTTVPDICFLTAQRPIGIVVICRIDVVLMRAVVARQDNDGIVGEPGPVQRIEDLSHGPVHLCYKVPILASLAFFL